MWNLFGTKPPEPEPLPLNDRQRLRVLEEAFDLMASDVDRCVNELPKIHAKLRMRATRAAQAEEEISVPSSSATPSISETPVSLSKAALRDLAQRRGLLSLQPRQRQGEG